ncbi:hypothetical protein TNCV_1018731 [Trichonephila clavipes]|nr:hypothetical protein TNCV_1018731 [Trichonephila clavipes]
MIGEPRQCTRSHGSICQAVSDEQKYYCDRASSLFTLFGPMRLFFYFLQLSFAEREPILPQLKRFRRKRKFSEGDIQKPRSRTVISNGGIEYRSV